MDVQEVKKQIAAMTATELAEVESFIHELLSDSAPVATPSEQDASPDPAADRSARILAAKREIFTEYDSLLSELAK